MSEKRQRTPTPSTYMTAEEIANTLGMSIRAAYTVIKELNAELQAKGYIIVRGRVSRKYFDERYYG